MRFATEEWVKALMDKVNHSERYARAARDWDGDFYFILKPEDGGEPVYMYIDLRHGKAREAFVTKDPSIKNPDFRIAATGNVWRRLFDKQRDPRQAFFSRQVQMTGNMTKLVKNIKAAEELVKLTAQVPTEFAD